MILLATQLLDMLTNRLDVARHCRDAIGIILCTSIVQISRQRHLRVDDHALAVGQVQDHIGAQVVALLIFEIGLHHIVLALDQIRVVENRRQDHLAHIALHLRIATNGLGQVVGFVGDAAVKIHQVFELIFQCAVTFDIVAVNRLDTQTKICNIIAEWLEQLFDRLRIGLAEHAALLLQNIVRQVAELLLHCLLHLLHLGLLLLGRGTLLLTLLFALLFERSLLIYQAGFECLDTHRATLCLGLHLALLGRQFQNATLQLLGTCRHLVSIATSRIALGHSLGTREAQLTSRVDQSRQKQHYD